MKEFKSLADFSKYLGKIIEQGPKRKLAILEAVGQLIEDKAKKKIGVYQAQAGIYEAWAPLADSTIQDRIRKGFTPDDPLLRSGELRDSIHHGIWEVTPDTVFIGSSSDIMIYQELGTITIPPRSVLAAAAFESKVDILRLIKSGAEAWFGDQWTFKLTPEIKT